MRKPNVGFTRASGSPGTGVRVPPLNSKNTVQNTSLPVLSTGLAPTSTLPSGNMDAGPSATPALEVSFRQTCVSQKQ